MYHSAEPAYTERMSRFLLLLVSTLISLAAAEGTLRALRDPPTKFFALAPGINSLFKPQPEIFPGISGESRYVTSSDGIRGDELASAPARRILVLGGSAAECIYLDGSEAWPRLLQEKLSATTGEKVWVGNIGASGQNSRDHLQQLRYLPPQYPEIKTYAVLLGVNDFLMRLKQGNDYRPLKFGTPEFDRESISRSFAIYPESLRLALYDSERHWYERFALWAALGKIKESRLFDIF